MLYVLFLLKIRSRELEALSKCQVVDFGPAEEINHQSEMMMSLSHKRGNEPKSQTSSGDLLMFPGVLSMSCVKISCFGTGALFNSCISYQF